MLAIQGLGLAVPDQRVEQQEVAEWVVRGFQLVGETAELVRSIHRHSGIDSRHLVFPARQIAEALDGCAQVPRSFLPNGHEGPSTEQRMALYRQHAPALACRAAAAALRDSGLRPREITHLVAVSCTGFTAPGIDAELIETLGLRATVERTQVGFMGCHGALNALRVAEALAGADSRRRLLVVAVELCSIHYRYETAPESLVTNALFADGAAAVVGGSEPSGGECWRVAATGSCVFPGSRNAMGWEIGDHGFRMRLSARIPELIRQNLRPWIEHWLDQSGYRLDQVRAWAVHPGGPRILESVEAALGLDPRATGVSREVLRRYGNMSSPTVLFVLDRLMRSEVARPAVALGFGPGLAAEAVLFA